MDRPLQKATVFAQGLAIAVVTAAQRDGLSPPDVCARFGIDAALLGRSDVRVTHDELCRTWSALAAGDEAFGLRAALLVDATPHSLVEYVFASARDVRGALRSFVRFQQLIHDASAHQLVEEPEFAAFRLGLAHGYALPLPLWDYLAGTLVLRFRRSAERPVDPSEVWLMRPTLEDGELARAIFRAPIRFGRPHAEVRYPPAFLASPMLTMDANLNALLTSQLERALGLPSGEHRVLPRAEPDVLVLVRRELRTALSRGEAELAKVARALGVSARSLQRRLQERGTSFQALVDDARRALAEELLAGQRATVTEAAFTTGFSDVAAFTRAFRRWTGLPPGEWARSH